MILFLLGEILRILILVTFSRMSGKMLGLGLFPVGVTKTQLRDSIYVKGNLYLEQQIKNQLLGYC